MLILAVLFALLLVSCDSSFKRDIPNVIPQINNLSFGSRVAIEFTEGPEQDKIQFIAHTPLLRSFSTNNDLKVGDNFSVDCYSSTMNFEIELRSENVYRFEGTMEDGSGWLHVEYEQENGLFSFEQGLFADLTFTDETDSGSEEIKAFVYASGTDLEIDSNGYFHGWINMGIIQESKSGMELTSMNAELFRGVMNAEGDVGTGVAIFCDDNTNADSGTRYFFQDEINVTTEHPDSVKQDNMTEWKEFFIDDDVLSNDLANAGWEILYNLDDSNEYIRISNDSMAESEGDYHTFDYFKKGFNEVTGDELSYDWDDLRAWKDVSIIIEAIEAME